MCVTPLQMLIAEHLIKENNKEEFQVVILSYDKNIKYDYYINKLKLICVNLIHFNVETDSKIQRLKEMLMFKNKINILKNVYFCKVFIASIENPFLLLLLSTIKFGAIYTFDDGTANINKESIYYRNLKIGFIESIIRKILGIKYQRDDIKKTSISHYTLYPSHDNIIPSTIPIQFLNTKSSELLKDSNNANQETISVFLGQPLRGINAYFDDAFIINIFEKYNINYYFPHPRERKRITELNYIDSPLIFEEYIITLIDQGYKINLFTFFSTAALNVSVLNNVKIYCLKNKFLENKYKEIYHVFRKFNNVSFKEIG